MDSSSASSLLSKMHLSEDGIYGYPFSNAEQSMEIELREKVASARYDNTLAKIAHHHSVPVMDYEVAQFLKKIPVGGRIIDVGGCWGWHWRNVSKTRPDVQVFIIDFVRANLLHAKALLGELINQSIFLVHGDATDLRFPTALFDGYWSVQTLQHVVKFETALTEAHRVLKKGGVFANYSLNDGAVIRWLSRAMNRKYVREGWVDGSYWLARASRTQKTMIERIFGSKVTEGWSEILFKPELKLTFAGRAGSWMGALDARMSNNRGVLRSLARQHSFQCLS